ncbi:TolB family protein [Hamadaea tsunoensis]|uniref:TolB family protein n=1 Tax=Hamadaea tsunoensis TaxID=53368 RepID=UPI0003F9A964|nr:PD40 domain-containing protein [Hamadaea tsunoensis]
MRTKLLVLLAAVVLLAGVGIGYVRYVASRAAASDAPAVQGVSLGAQDTVAAVSTAPGERGRVVFVHDGRRDVSALSCTRFYAAGGAGVCLRPDGPLATYQVARLTSTLDVAETIPLVGVPNRARVSADGKLLAWTVFVTGDSYNNGRFSTRVGILDARTGDVVATLEDFAVFVGDRAYQAADLNFWGVTFLPDDNRFYATMSTKGHRYLVAGDIRAQTVRTVAYGGRTLENVECPSLSPDGTRLAFKAAVGGDPARGWRLSVLDLATGAVTPTAETRSVDDQAAWISTTTLAYAIPRGQGSDVWAVDADGGGRARVLIPDAASPAAL